MITFILTLASLTLATSGQSTRSIGTHPRVVLAQRQAVEFTDATVLMRPAERVKPIARSAGLARWRDPLTRLPVRIQRALACVRWVESRNHVIDGPSFPGAGEGLYQFIPSTWAQIRAHEPWLAATPNRASRYQQDQAACWEYHHNGRLAVAWSGDYSCLRMAGE